MLRLSTCLRIVARNSCCAKKPFVTRCVYNLAHAPNSTFESNCLLNDLSKAGRIHEAQELFDEMSYKDEFTWNTMISAYANLGRLDEARKLFGLAPSKSLITWSALISGCSRHGCENEAFELFWQMQLDGHRPSQFTLGSCLGACSELGVIQRGKEIHGYVIKSGFDSNAFVVTGLVYLYAKGGFISEAEFLFRRVTEKNNRVLWSAMISGYSRNGYGFQAMKCFQDMRIYGVDPNQFTFPSILTACASVSAVGFGVQVHGCIVRSGFDTNVFVQSALVDMYAKCGNLRSARTILYNMEINDIISWNSMIVGCVRQGSQDEALNLFKKMRARDIKIDDFTYPSMLNSFALLLDLANAISVHCLIVKTGFDNYKIVNNALIDMYAKLRDMDCAIKVFRHMIEKDVISWTSMVTGYSHNGSHEEALRLFCDMKITGVCPDEIIVASVISSCAELTLLDFGQEVHGSFVKSGKTSSVSVNNSLVTFYAKCGCVEDANLIFDSMQVRDVVTWTSLIVAYARNAKGKESLRLYEQMITCGVQPDYITFIGLLFACSHVGLVADGHRYFESMTENHGIKPGPEHYACMIDLLGRSGKLSEAEKLLDEMVVEPDATVWKALLGACRVHKNLELGEKAAQNLFSLEPTNAVPYVQLCNIYFSAGKLEDAAKIRKLMKLKGINKEPGFSWIEVNGSVHTFTSEYRGHPRMTEIYSKNDKVMQLIKKAGYVPDISYDLHNTDGEGSESNLAYHSEKLAVAFGLLTLPSEKPIRIFKNLRVCGDCHIAMKFISRVYNRHIVLRDSNCFHHFQGGICSCGDYW